MVRFQSVDGRRVEESMEAIERDFSRDVVEAEMRLARERSRRSLKIHVASRGVSARPGLVYCINVRRCRRALVALQSGRLTLA